MTTIPTRIGNYEILEQIGAGGMGVVYKARHARIRRDRIVALKLMLPAFTADAELQERFQREIDIVDKLQHPNIVTVLDAGEHEGQPYLVMEYLEGQTLEKCVAEKSLGLDKKLEVMASVCRGLDYAHQQGIVHRDVKPANIFLLGGQTPKILDFGVAHVSKHTMTKAGMMVGTINYMSPEQLNGQRVDGRSDVFSAGVVLYELVAGCVPFEGSDPVSTIKKILMDPAPPLWDYLDEYPPRLEKILATALAKEPGKRYQTAGEMAEEIDRVRGIAARAVAAAAAPSASATAPAKTLEPLIEKAEISASQPDSASQLLPTEIAVEHDTKRSAEQEGLQAGDEELTVTPSSENLAAGAQIQPERKRGLGIGLLVVGLFALYALIAVVWFRSGTRNDQQAADPGSSSPPVASQPPDPYPQAKQYYDQKDYAHALPLMQQAAEQGNESAQFWLGFMYHDGTGVKRNYQLAARWFRKAADQGDAIAQDMVGLLYQQGNGVEKSLPEAAKWYRKAAEKGYAGSQLSLAEMYEHGEGVTRDLNQAVEWYRKAAAQGDADATNALKRLGR